MAHIARPIAKSFPAVVDLKRDPAGTLSYGPVEIVDRPIAGLIVSAVGAVIAFVIPSIKLRVLFTGLVLGLPVYLYFFPRRVIFASHGLEYTYGRNSAFIPWSAFDMAAVGLNYDLLHLTIHRQAVGTVEHRRDGVVVAYGVWMNSYHLEITATGVLKLRVPMGAERRELGEIVLHVAKSFQSTTPSLTPLAELRSR
ncbi:MAG TPA: hypothetical protein VH120_06100 [Gemmataceae bacterium]|jgi:hypothetical protein|nr:hypothetical protein [Gemmataceae bacterium]